MATLRLDDVISSVEAWLIDNWPDSSVAFAGSAADVRRPYTGGVAKTHVQAQWISYEPAQPVRPTEDWNVFDLRLVINASDNDRLKAAEIADGLRDLMRSGTVEVVDRGDGSTARGWVRFNEVGITPPQKDARDVVVAVVDVEGWAHSA